MGKGAIDAEISTPDPKERLPRGINRSAITYREARDYQ
jgi:hypothetical protein